MAAYDKAGLLLVRGHEVLLCRKKHGTSKLILPGGRIEPGETYEQCLRREIQEELGNVTLSKLEYLGHYSAPSTDPGKDVTIELYAGTVEGDPQASNEIAELVWFDLAQGDWSLLAPSLSGTIFPDLLARGRLRRSA